MRTFVDSLKILSLGLALVPACDDPLGASEDDSDDPVAFRCYGLPSTCMPSNTSLLGGFDFSNIKKAIGSSAANWDSSITIAGGTVYWQGANRAIAGIDVTNSGELRLSIAGAGVVGGADVQGATFTVTVSPYNPKSTAFTGMLRVASVASAPGKYDATMTIWTYEFQTDIPSTDPALYPVNGAGMYPTCANLDDGGLLSNLEKYRVFLSPGVSLTQGSNPEINLASTQFMMTCLQSASAKGQYFLNTFFTPGAYRALDASQRTAMLKMWMAWFDGETQTSPGRIISPHDPINGYFTWVTDSMWEVEASYNSTGAHCRGGPAATGRHRLHDPPVTLIPGWVKLPQCATTDYVIGVKAPPQP